MIEAKLKTSLKDINRNNCFISISLNNKKCSGENLDAILDWTFKNFEFAHIHIGDEIQAWNIMAENNIDFDSAKIKAHKMAAEWVNENSKYLEKYQGQYELIFWERWRKNNNYNEYLETIRSVYRSNKEFRAILYNDVEKFVLKRNTNLNLNENNYQRVIECSINYLLEEMAGFSVQYDLYDYPEIYPGSQPECLKVLRENLFTDLPSSFSKSKNIKLFLCDKEPQQIAA